MAVDLRRLQTSDRELVYLWRTSEYVARWMLNDSSISEVEHALWFDRALVDGLSKVRIISYRGIDCGLLSWKDEGEGKYTFGIYVITNLVKLRGVGRIALRLLLDELFSEGRTVLVSAEVLKKNERAIEAYSSLGFTTLPGSTRTVSRMSGNSELIEMQIDRRAWERLGVSPGHDTVKGGSCWETEKKDV